ncbi:hypothetical protein BD626DRAFT_167153 [Schizophyllum amplum]|uniref:Peptidase C19 ubiquitin carboxyl-terminal hydrolase domain-containing protein n=1 Tax=Schizophyllum amplum TaxID=97359 RepID=A0A550CQ97_9AGAR|nr:hypothetical protein BD626DRAFT_167153 [Auriculariopsis ampla]
MADRLKRIAEKLEDEVAAIDQRILAVEGQLSQLHNTPALQNVKYDLRAVIVHTGMPGRKSVYTYVQDGREQWWKMVEAQVTEVDEATVLTDPTGMQLGAGPLLLIYSRAISAEERWDMEHCRYHEHFMSNVLQCNAQYFEKLPDDVKARIEATWGSADAFVRRGMPAQALSPGRTASPSMSMPVDSTPPRGVSRLDGPPPRSDSLPKSAAHTMSPTHTMSPAQGMSPMHTGSPKQSSVHRQALRKNSAATTRDAIMRDPPLQHRDASARDVPPHQAREGRDAPPHQPHRDASMGRTDGPHGPREASMGRSSPSLSRDASMPAS